MNELVEGDLKVTLPIGIEGRKFDNETHGLSHCMKAVDFIVELNDKIIFVELNDKIIFVELKDVDSPSASENKDRNKFLSKFLSGGIDSDLQYKYRDSYLYELASGRADKPIYYYVLIGAEALSDADLLARTDALKRNLPVYGANSKPWKKPFVAGCAVMNLLAWNKVLPMYPASRLSQ
ncbi:MAG: hypothetical protein ABL902_09435 [Gallionella sp.]